MELLQGVPYSLPFDQVHVAPPAGLAGATQHGGISSQHLWEI
jgi:hypothetical protein